MLQPWAYQGLPHISQLIHVDTLFDWDLLMEYDTCRWISEMIHFQVHQLSLG